MNKILCIKTHAIGDLLMTTPAIRALHNAIPHAKICVLTGKWSAPVLKNNPHIRETIEFDDDIFFKKKFFKIASLILRIRKMKFDTALIFHTSPFIHLFALLAGIKNRIGLRRNNQGWFLTQYINEIADNNYYYPNNFLKLLETINIFKNDYSLDIYYSKNEIDTISHLLNLHNIKQNDRIIIVAAGGAHNPKESINARLWPKEYYSLLIEKIYTSFPDIKLLLVGAKNDIPINAFLSKKNIPTLINLTAKTTINDLAYLIEKAMLIICNDSSILHIGIAKKKPVICFLGPTFLKSRIPPEMSCYSIQSTTNCSPCYKYAIFQVCKNNIRCMYSISPDIAFERVNSFIMKR